MVINDKCSPTKKSAKITVNIGVNEMNELTTWASYFESKYKKT